jgi:gamma-glutamyltranspeptidase
MKNFYIFLLVSIKKSLDSLTLLKLKQMGYDTKLRPTIGQVNSKQVLPDDVLKGGADKRGYNTACGY